MSPIHWYIGGFHGLASILRNYLLSLVFAWKTPERLATDQRSGDVFHVFTVTISAPVELTEGEKATNPKKHLSIINYYYFFYHITDWFTFIMIISFICAEVTEALLYC